MDPPHPSEKVPQVPSVQPTGVQPQVLATPPPPQVLTPLQVQLSVPPQPSGMVPQKAPAEAQLVGTQLIRQLPAASPGHA